MKLIKQDERGSTYQADGFRILYRKKGSVSGDNDINEAENIYLIEGYAKVTLDQQKPQTIVAPANFYIPENTHHKIEALTNITLIMVT
jgi:quercetin dioxygenase-like cupin family protein